MERKTDNHNTFNNGLNAFLENKEVSGKESGIRILEEWIIAYFCFIALGGLLYCILMPEAEAIAFIIAGALFTFFFRICFSCKRRRTIGIVALAVVIIIMLIVWNKEAVNGLILTANRILNLVGEKTGRIYIGFQPVLEGSKSYVSEIIFMLFLSILLSSLSVYRSRRKNILLSIIMVVFQMLLIYYFAESISVLWIMMPLTAELILISRHSIIKSGYRIGEGRGTLICMLVILSIIMTASWAAIRNISYKSRAVENIKADILNKIDCIRYGNSSGDNLPQGEFKNLSSLKRNNTPVLEVIMSKPESLYLRGFVGSQYTWDGWSKADNKNLYEDGNLFYWLHKNSFYGQTQLSSTALLIEQSEEENSTINITINNLSGSRKYVYTPYELVNAGHDALKAEAIGDETLYSDGFRGSSLYSFTSLTNKVKRASSMAAKLDEIEKSGNESIEEYLKLESYYNQFVYKTYTSIPENVENILKNHLGEYETNGKAHMDYKEAESRILKYLIENTQYSEEVVSNNNNVDFLQYFLEVSKKGYSVHYATAAALMFRYYGIPARYVEGYIITPQDVDGVLANSAITIDGTHAHAWVEIYRDGIGWVPFEATPAYFNIMEQDQEIEGLGTTGSQDTENPIQKMKEDNYEDEDTTIKEQLQNSLRRAANVAVYFVLALLLAAAVFILYKLIKRKIVIRKRENGLRINDLKKAIEETFAYSMELIYAAGLEKENISLEDYTKQVEELFGEELCKDYEKAVAIYKEAHFSSHPMTTGQRDFIREFQIKVVNKSIEKFGFNKKLSLKYKYYLI